MRSQKIELPSIYMLLLACIFIFSACNSDDSSLEMASSNTLNWNFDNTDFEAKDELNAIMNYSIFASVRHLTINGTSPSGEKLTLFVQELHPSGDMSCLSIQRYGAEIDPDNCEEDEFLTICDHGACEYTLSDGTKVKSLDDNGQVMITSCDHANKTISGNFTFMLVGNNLPEPELTFTGSFTNVIYVEE